MTKRAGRRLNHDIDRQLKRAGLRPMAEAWPPDPVRLGPFGIRLRAGHWWLGFVSALGSGLALVWWLG